MRIRPGNDYYSVQQPPVNNATYKELSMVLRRALHSIAMVLCLSNALLQLVRADDWPQFLGSNRDGVAMSSVKLVDRFPPTGPKVVWRAPAGIGMSGIVVVGKNCLLIARRNAQQTLVAFQRDTGKLLWESPLAPAYDNAMGDGARATPTVQGTTVYCFTGEGVLAARDLKDGSELWTRNLATDMETEPSEYGLSSSPLVVDGQVIVQVGGDSATLVSVDAKSGKTRWTAGQGRAGYSSPALLSVAGKPQVVAFTGAGCLGLSPRDGKQLWFYPFSTDYDCNTATPIAIKGKVLITSGENHGTALLEISEDAPGKFSASEVWTQFGTTSGLRSEWQTPVLIGDHLFGFDNVGSAGPITNLVCMEAATGKVLWKKSRFGKSNGIAADGKLLVSTMAGEIVLVKADPSEFTELARATIIGKNRQAPALSDGFLFLRDDEEIVCIDLRAL
jgi:outer membrane protein assembly factor BamB